MKWYKLVCNNIEGRCSHHGTIVSENIATKTSAEIFSHSFIPATEFEVVIAILQGKAQS